MCVSTLVAKRDQSQITTLKNKLSSSQIHLESQLLLDLSDRETWVQSLWTRPRAVENGVAAVDGHRVVERSFALHLPLVS